MFLTNSVGFWGFSPASLFAAGETGLWLSSSDIDSLFQLSNGTTAVAANNDPVGYWTDLSGNGNHCIQATAGNRPLYKTAGPAVLFDGTTDYLSVASRLIATIGSVIVRFTTGSALFSAGAQVLVSCADTGTDTSWFEIGVTALGEMYFELNNAGTKHTVLGSTLLEVSTAYTAILAFNGTDYWWEVDGVEQNPQIIQNVGTPGWFGDIAIADNTVIGGAITSAGLVRPWKGSISELIITSQDITA
jgi:hypothetical protein